jgi:hypothetical protein
MPGRHFPALGDLGRKVRCELARTEDQRVGIGPLKRTRATRVLNEEHEAFFAAGEL